MNPRQPVAGPRFAGYLQAAVSVGFWGASFVAAKVALRSVSPEGLVAGRSLLGFLVLALASIRRDERTGTPRPKDRSRIVLLGIVGLPVHLGIQALALTLTSAVHSGWLIALNPVFTAILAAFFLRERFPPLKVAGVVLGFAGALVVISGGAGASALSLPSTRGDLLILLSSVNWAAYTLVARNLMIRSPALRTTFEAFAVGTLASVVGYAMVGDLSEVGRVTAEGWVALGFLGVGCTGLGYLAWSAALTRLEAGTLSSFQYVQPLVTVALASWWIAEPIGTVTLAGGALVIAGVFLVQKAAR